MKIRNNRQVEIYLMVGALLLILVGIPGILYAANGFNGFLSGSASLTQIENSTAFYEGPILDEDLENRYASVNGTTVTAETPTWDTSDEWDQVIITSTETDNKLVFNWNKTVSEILNSKIYQVIFKTNITKEIKLTINAVKWDGTTLTSVEAHSITHIGVDNNTVYWNFTASEILYIQTQLNPAIADEVYFQFIFEGYDSDNKLTTGDTLVFQFAYAEPSNVYTFTSWQVLTFTASIMGLLLCFVALASTPYWNPLIGRYTRKRKKQPKKNSKKRRR